MFDSGFGGLTVARAVIDLLPAEDLVYVADRRGPGARAAVSVTCNGHVGVIGTVGTIASGAYQREVAALRPSPSVS